MRNPRKIIKSILNFIQNNPYFSIFIGLVVILALYIFIKSFSFQEAEQLAAFQVSLELLNLIALIFAIAEFAKNREKPNIRIRITNNNQSFFLTNGENILKPMKFKLINYEVFFPKLGKNKMPPYNESGMLHYEFKIYLDNIGKVMGKYVFFVIEFRTIPQFKLDRTRIQGMHFEYSDTAWKSERRKGTLEETIFTFMGGDDFIVYSHFQDKSNHNYFKYLTTIIVDIPVLFSDIEQLSPHLSLLLQAEGQELLNYRLDLEIPSAEDCLKLISSR